MMHTLIEFLLAVGSTIAAVLLGAGVLHTLPRLGAGGQRLVDGMCAGLPLDGLVTYFTVLPPVVLGFVFGWEGVAGGVVGQILGLLIWTGLHELAHRNTPGRGTILGHVTRATGPVRNFVATYWTAWAVPLFWLVRLAEWFVYPPLTWLIQLPKYDSREWVNVSRHKFTGLVGHDRIWCLYCDWMTGVWSLGTEMLRNVESFWCPIRFRDPAKCANCRIDFPDIADGWTDAGGDMTDVQRVLDEQYGPSGEVVPRSWFGHPSRTQGLTVRGRAVGDDEGA